MSDSNGHDSNGRFRNPYETFGQENPDRDFPMRQFFTDFSGATREFEISYYRVSLGFGVHAAEIDKGHDGYFFREYDPTSPYLALGRICDRIREILATRHLEKSSPDVFHLTHRKARGRVSYHQGEVAFVIDGQFLTLEQFGKMIVTFEGFEFQLDILD